MACLGFLMNLDFAGGGEAAAVTSRHYFVHSTHLKRARRRMLWWVFWPACMAAGRLSHLIQ